MIRCSDPEMSMGLIRDLVEIKRLKKMTNNMVESGLLTEEQREEIWDSAREAGRQAYAESKAKQRGESQRSSSRGCCANCVYFSESLTLDAYCSKNGYSFTVDEVVDDVKYRRTCSSFRASW